MKEWTKYILDNVKDAEVLHYCVEGIRKDYTSAYRAIAEEKNQLAAELIADMLTYIELLEALDKKTNGDKKTTVVA